MTGENGEDKHGGESSLTKGTGIGECRLRLANANNCDDTIVHHIMARIRIIAMVRLSASYGPGTVLSVLQHAKH